MSMSQRCCLTLLRHRSTLQLFAERTFPLRPWRAHWRWAASGSDAGLRNALQEAGAAAAVQHAYQQLGQYSGNEAAWQSVTQHILEEGQLSEMGLGDVKNVVKVLAEDVKLTQASFWELMTGRLALTFQAASLNDLMEIGEQYTKIQAYSQDCALVFHAIISRVRKDMSIHSMEPPELVKLMAIFGRAGASSKSLSRVTAQLFNEMEDRISEGVEDFNVEDCISLIDSMAKFRAVKVPVLQELGKEVLHSQLPELTGQQVCAVCHAYGELGWRHDTVFKTISTEILEENEELKSARVYGFEHTKPVKYSGSDIAFVTFAMLRLKMHRGNTSWYKWADTYRELLDILTLKLEEQLTSMEASALAAASFVLGRARRGTDTLYKAMYGRIMQILAESEDRQQQPVTECRLQDELARFLHGLSMMGPSRQKDLDTQPLLQWLCKHVYTFVLSDFILVNRYLVAMQCCDRDYLIMLVPFYCSEERSRQLTKDDIQELTNTYNGAKVREGDIPDGLGAHFFWMLGRQYQRLHVEKTGSRRGFQRIG